MRTNLHAQRRRTLVSTRAFLASTALIALPLMHTQAQAETTNWTGSISTNWFDAGNWTAGVPDAGDEVIMNTQTPNQTVISTPGAVGEDVFVSNGVDATLTVTGAGTLNSRTFATTDAPTGVGTVNVINGGNITTTEQFNVGQEGDSVININTGGTVAGRQISIGESAGHTSTVNVDGAGSEIRKTDIDDFLFHVGFSGVGILNVTNGGAAISENDIGVGTLGTGDGRVTVDGEGSLMRGERGLTVGNVGTGLVTIQNQGTLQTPNAVIGAFDNPPGFPGVGNGTVTVTGAGSSWLNSTTNGTGTLFLGAQATGVVNILDGGNLISNNLQMAQFDTGDGTLNIDGAGSFAGFTRISRVGLEGTGTVNVTNGGTWATGVVGNTAGLFVAIGDEAGSTGTVNVDGADSFWGSAVNIAVGLGGTGTVNIVNGGELAFGQSLNIGVEAGSMGTVRVSGAGSTLEQINGTLLNRIGGDGDGQLIVENGATATFFETVFLGEEDDSSGLVRVTGAGSTFNMTNGESFVMDNGTTRLEVLDGASFISDGSLGTGLLDAGNHTVIVDGPGSTVFFGGLISLGRDAGTTTVAVTNGASFTTDSFIFVSSDEESTASFLVDGAGSVMTVASEVRTGAEGVGTTTISGGATATWGRANIGVEGTGTVNVTGTGSVLNVGDIDIGEDVGTGTLNISGGAVVNQTGGNPVVIAEDDASTGTLNIGGPGAPMAPGTLNVPSIQFGEGNATLNFNHSANDFAFMPGLEGTGAINLLSGNTELAGNGTPFAGITEVDGGNLQVTGSLGGVIRVTDGVLSGTGTINNADVFDKLAPGASIGTLTATGDVTFSAGSIFEVEIAADGSSDLLDVAGTATLAGTMSVLGVGYPVGFPDAQTYTVLTAGAVNGTFETVTDNLPDVDVTAIYSATNVQVAYMGAVVDPDPDPNPNPDPDPDPDPNPDPGPTPTVSDKSIYANTLQAALRVSPLYNQSLLQRAMSGAGGGADFLVAPNAYFGGADAVVGGQSTLPSIGTWVGVLGEYAQVDATALASGYDGRLAGMTAGLDGNFTTDGGTAVRLGASFGHIDGDVTSGLASADSETWLGGIYTGIVHGPLNLSAAASYGHGDYDITRTIPLAGMAPAVASGDSGGGTYAIALQAAYDVAPMLGIGGEHDLRVAPLVRFDHAGASLDGFVETGAGILNQTVAGTSWDRSWAGIGVQISAAFDAGGGAIVRPELELRYQHGFGDDNAVVASSIAGAAGANFVSPGAAEGDHAFVIGTGVQIDFNERFSTHLRYDGTFSENHDGHAGSARLALTF
ncbi:MAG: hypothetical protein CME90_00720 [Hoeflea sp.]|nr:hypothetical protein [Hoeflea sp.]